MENQEKNIEVTGRITAAAFGLFRTYGMRAVTMDEIANHTGMSKKTLYACFTDKNDLVTTVVQQRVDELRAVCESYQRKAQDAVEELLLMMQYLEGLFRNMNPVIVLDMQKYYPEAYRIFREYLEGFVLGSIRENLQRGISEALYREDINIDVISKVRLESCMICFRPDIFPKDQYEMSHVQKELVFHFLFGVATLKGHKLVLKYRQKIFNKK